MEAAFEMRRKALEANEDEDEDPDSDVAWDSDEAECWEGDTGEGFSGTSHLGLVDTYRQTHRFLYRLKMVPVLSYDAVYTKC